MRFIRQELKPLIEMLNSPNVEDNNLALEIFNTHYKGDKRAVKLLMRKSKLDCNYIKDKNHVIIDKKYFVNINKKDQSYIISQDYSLWKNY